MILEQDHVCVRRHGDEVLGPSQRRSFPPYNDPHGSDFLRENMATHLALEPARFDFMVQLRTHPASMPIEDPTIEWSERESAFLPVARITIPPQEFRTTEQLAFCENLSFSPWHAIPEHRPLGGINRIRQPVYDTSSRIRHELNDQPRLEPQEDRDS